jgi:hypothetical protein
MHVKSKRRKTRKKENFHIPMEEVALSRFRDNVIWNTEKHEESTEI